MQFKATESAYYLTGWGYSEAYKAYNCFSVKTTRLQ